MVVFVATADFDFIFTASVVAGCCSFCLAPDIVFAAASVATVSDVFAAAIVAAVSGGGNVAAGTGSTGTITYVAAAAFFNLNDFGNVDNA